MSDLPAPVPPVPSATGPAPTGGTLVKSAWSALRQDHELISLPVIGALCTLLAMAPLALVAALSFEDQSALGYVALVGIVFIASLITTFFAVALAAGAHERLNGGDPTVRSALAVAWRRKRGVVGWALLSTTVGLVLRAVEERFGWIARFIGDVAWGIASFFALPVIAANDVGPIEALKLSASTFKQRWGSAVRVELRLALYSIAVAVVAVVGVVAVIALAESSLALAVLIGIIVGAVVLAGVLVLTALSAYTRVVLYRYASGLPTPGFAMATIESSIRPKKGRW